MESKYIPEVSIIVPVYNVEKYVGNCLQSILNQTFTDWECIVVDDGATDSSGRICDEYAEKDNRFRVLHVKNGGLSSARNNGIRAARGKYITFCDSDDWLAPEAIATMHTLITENEADIVQTGLWKDFEDHNRVKHLTASRCVFNRNEAIMELIRNKRVPSYVWNKMFRRELIGPDFPEGETFEDIHVCTLWFPRIRKMVVDPTPLYHYRMRAGSILHAGSSKYRMDFLNAMKFRANKIMQLGLESFTRKEYDKLVAKSTISAAKIIARQEKDKEKRKAILKTLGESLTEINIPGIATIGPKQWLRANLLRSNPQIFSILMRGVGKTDLHSRYRNRHLFS